MKPIRALSCVVFAVVTVAAGSPRPSSRVIIPDALASIGATVVDGKGDEIGWTFFVLDCHTGGCALSTSTFMSSDRIVNGASSASCAPMQGITSTADSTLYVSVKDRTITTGSGFTLDGCDGLTRLKLEFEFAPVSSGKYKTLKTFSGLLVRDKDGSVQAHILPLKSDHPRSVDLPTLPE